MVKVLRSNFFYFNPNRGFVHEVPLGPVEQISILTDLDNFNGSSMVRRNKKIIF